MGVCCSKHRYKDYNSYVKAKLLKAIEKNNLEQLRDTVHKHINKFSTQPNPKLLSIDEPIIKF